MPTILYFCYDSAMFKSSLQLATKKAVIVVNEWGQREIKELDKELIHTMQKVGADLDQHGGLQWTFLHP